MGFRSPLYILGFGTSDASEVSFLASQKNIRLSLLWHQPLWVSTKGFGDLTDYTETYTHTISASGGFDTVDAGIKTDYQQLSDWLLYGLGRHMECNNEAAEPIWEGFVNEISVSLGPLSLTRGPLTEIGNRITVKYSDATVGSPARTTALNDVPSQEAYSIIHKVISAGQVSSTTASNIRATYLNENKFPETSTSLSNTGNEFSMSLRCLGYQRFFDLYPYNQATDTTYTLREKIIEVIEQEPNSIFSLSYSQIEANSLSVFRKDNDDRFAGAIIQELVGVGGSSNNNRRLFGVERDQRIYLKEVPNAPIYQIRLADPGNSLETIGGTFVYPWNIRAGEWIQVVDFPGLGDLVVTSRQDPSRIFIESISYTAPFGWTINGGKLNTMEQQLNKLGLGGI